MSICSSDFYIYIITMRKFFWLKINKLKEAFDYIILFQNSDYLNWNYNKFKQKVLTCSDFQSESQLMYSFYSAEDGK